MDGAARSNAVAGEAKVEQLESCGGRLGGGAERGTQLLARSRRFALRRPTDSELGGAIGQAQFSDPSVRVIHRQCAPPLFPTPTGDARLPPPGPVACV